MQNNYSEEIQKEIAEFTQTLLAKYQQKQTNEAITYSVDSDEEKSIKESTLEWLERTRKRGNHRR